MSGGAALVSAVSELGGGGSVIGFNDRAQERTPSVHPRSLPAQTSQLDGNQYCNHCVLPAYI